MKKIISLLLVLALGFCMLASCGLWDDLEYELTEDGEGYIAKGKSSDTEHIKIPDTHKGKPVVALGHFPCYSLKKIEIPAGIKSTENRAFEFCDLEEVYIEDLKAWCNMEFLDYMGQKYNYATNPLASGAALYLNGTLVTDLVIPDGITEIQEDLFSGCNSIVSVTIPDGVTSIGDSAFSGCDALATVAISDSVTSIGDYAFHYCSNLTSVTIPDSVTYIGSYCFTGCENLKRIDFEGTEKQWRDANGYWAVNSITVDVYCKDGVISHGLD